MVKKIVLDHELQQIPLITLEEALELLKMNKLEIKQEDIKSLNETQYLKSLIYCFFRFLIF